MNSEGFHDPASGPLLKTAEGRASRGREAAGMGGAAAEFGADVEDFRGPGEKGANGYDISFYDPAQVPGTTPPGTATPLRTVRLVQMPDEDGGVTKVGRLLESDGNKIREFRFKTLPGDTKSWDLREGTFSGTLSSPGTISFRIKTVVTTGAVAGDSTSYIETREVTDYTYTPAKVVKKEIDTCKEFTFSFGTEIRLVKNQVDPDPGGRNLTTERYYYTSGPAEGKVMRVHYPSGDWRHYQYMTDNDRLYRTYSPFGQTAPPASVSAVPPIAGAVIVESDFNSTPGWLRRDSLYTDDNISRRAWYKKEGDPATTGVTWTEVRAYTPSAAVNNANNLTTVSVHYPETPSAVSSGLLKREETPDGQVRQYAYSELAAGGGLPRRIRTVEQHGPRSGSPGGGGLYTLTQGTQTVTEKTLGGQFVSELVTDIASGKVLKNIVVEDADGFGRPLITLDNLTGRRRYTSYACCGVDREQDFDGMITAYGYDMFGNRIREQKGYRPGDDNYQSPIEDIVSDLSWDYDTQGRVVKEYRTPAGGVAEVIATHEYNTAGDLIKSTDILGAEYHHRSHFTGNRRVETTSYPLSGTPPLYRTEEKRYNRDGRLYSSRVYASTQRCDSVAIPSVNTSGSGDIDNSVLKYLTYTYAQGSVYFTERVNNAGKGGSTSAPDHRITETDMLGRVYRTARPNSTGTLIYNTYYYYTASEAAAAGTPAAFGKLRRADYADGRSVFYRYDARGRQSHEITDRNNNAPDLTSDDTVIETEYFVIDADGISGRGAWKTVTSTYTPPSNTKVTLGERVEDASGLSVKVTRNGVTAVTTKSHIANGWWNILTLYSDTAYGDVSTYAAGRLYFEEKRDSARFAYTYDSLGRLHTRTPQRTGEPVTYTYHADDQMHTIEEPSAAASGTVTTTLTYDALGNLTQRQLPGIANPQIWTYNALGQMIESNGVEQYPVRYKYDDRGGRPRELTTGVGSTTQGATTWTYNANGWLTQKRDADGEGADYTYQTNGLLSTRQWARLVAGSPSTRLTTTYTYNQFTAELSGVSYNDTGTPAPTPGYTVAFDRLGRLSNVTQGGNSWTYAYDPANLFLDTETIVYDTDFNGIGDFTRVLDRSRDAHRRNTGWELKSGGTVQHANAYAYAPYSGKFSTVTQGADVFTYMHPSYSTLIGGMTGPHGISVHNEWETRRDVLDYRENSVNYGSTVISKYDYTVNDLGRRTQLDQTGTIFGGGYTINWGYNARGEVTSSDYLTRTSVDRFYAYDTAGNRERWRLGAATDSGGTLVNFTANTRNQYTAISGGRTASPQYDADGNQLTGFLPVNPAAAATWIWDAENRLIEAKSNGTTVGTYRYDPFGRRMYKNSAGGAYWFIYDGWNLIAEYQGGALHRAHTWGLDASGAFQGAGGVGGLLSTRILAGTGAGATYYPLYDGNGNVTQYINSAGTVVHHTEFDPSGAISAHNSPVIPFYFRFSTKYQDFETGLSYYGYRYLDTQSGRWINRDPIGEEGGVNLYGFVGNDGVNFYDLLGLKNCTYKVRFTLDQRAVDLGKKDPRFFSAAIDNSISFLQRMADICVKNNKCCCESIKIEKEINPIHIENPDLKFNGPDKKQKSQAVGALLESLKGDADVPVLYTGQGITTPSSSSINKVAGISVDSTDSPIYKPQSGGIVLASGSPEVLAHEIGHYIGWSTTKNLSMKGDILHSNIKNHLMSYDYESIDKISVDGQWCKKFCDVAAK